MSTPEYKLVYHAGLPGRGEFIRLQFEATGTPYVDTAREEGQGAVFPYLEDGAFPDSDKNLTPFAPPVLVHGEVVLSQTSNIALYLHSKLPPITFDDDGSDDPSKKKVKSSTPSLDDLSTFQANQLYLSCMDLTVEAHDTHHPISNALYYEDQKEAALESAKHFRETRAPKYLTFFENTLKKSNSGVLLSSGLPSYADLALFQTVDGLKHAFPKFMNAQLDKNFPLVKALHEKVKSAPRIRRYLESDRRSPYTLYGLFRHYPELDEQ